MRKVTTRRIRRLLCTALICLLALHAALAQGEPQETPAPQETMVADAPAPAEEQSREPASDPVETPEAEPTEEPVTEPSQEPTTEPTPEPISEPVAEASVKPSQEPLVEPTVEPTPELTEEPANEPSQEPAVELTAESTPELTEAPASEPIRNLSIRISSPQNLNIVEGVYQIDTFQTDLIVFSWDAEAQADRFDIAVSNSEGSLIFTATQEEPFCSISTAELPADEYILVVAASFPNAITTNGELRFALIEEEKPDEGFPDGGFPRDRFTGGRFGRGGFSRSISGAAARGSSGDFAETIQGFRITPGEALIGSHYSGTKDMRLYGTVNVNSVETPTTTLAFDDEILDIALDEGSREFTAAVDGAYLLLTPCSEGEAWRINGFALKTLAQSGIEKLVLAVNDAVVELPTMPDLQGSIYGKLRAEGLVSSDYSYTVSADGIRVSVDNADYVLSESCELIHVEE